MFQLKESVLKEIKSFIETDAELSNEYNQIISTLAGVKYKPQEKPLVVKRDRKIYKGVTTKRTFILNGKALNIKTNFGNTLYDIIKNNGPISFDDIYKKLPPDSLKEKDKLDIRSLIASKIRRGLFIPERGKRQQVKGSFVKYSVNPELEEIFNGF